jgi:predicted nicotinamide N-methyase
MDGKEESVLIGEALWHGGKILANWIVNRNPAVFEGATVLEVGSGPGLAGLSCGLNNAKKVVLTDYKPQVMKLIARNIKAFREDHTEI